MLTYVAIIIESPDSRHKEDMFSLLLFLSLVASLPSCSKILASFTKIIDTVVKPAEAETECYLTGEKFY